MDSVDGRHPFDRRIVLVENRPHIYIKPSSERDGVTGKPPTSTADTKVANAAQKRLTPPVSFFGHRLGGLFLSEKTSDQEFLSIDRELETSLERVRKKLEITRTQRSPQLGKAAEAEIQHQRFIEERNRAQEALFEDIVRRHRDFGTGLGAEDLWSLHDLMLMEADHEAACSAESSIHQLIECNLIQFFRKKAAENAWQRVEDYMAKFQIPFPMSPAMEDPHEPVRNNRVREEVRKSAQKEFIKIQPRQLAELILGNVPAWAYSYPQRDSYLWKLVVLQGVGAALAADFLMKHLAVWEEHSREILSEVEHKFTHSIESIRQRGESATEIPEILSVSRELQNISTEQIPDEIWKQISLMASGAAHSPI